FSSSSSLESSSAFVSSVSVFCLRKCQMFRACCPNRKFGKENSAKGCDGLLKQCSHHDGTTQERSAALQLRGELGEAGASRSSAAQSQSDDRFWFCARGSGALLREERERVGRARGDLEDDVLALL